MELHGLQVLGIFVLFINLSLQHDEFAIRRQSRKVSRSLKDFFMNRKALLNRQKRAWIIDTFELQEEHPGPYPFLIGTVNVENGFQVRYKLTGIGVTEEPTGMFHINEDDGSIYVHQKIDYEQFTLFRWEFNAINRTSLEVDTRLGIQLKILDINDNAPEFSSKYYEISVNESAVQGVSFYSLVARDKDEASSPNSEVSYSLLWQKPADANVEFTINSQKGFLSFKGCLDYETTKNYKLMVQASDNGRSVKQSSTCEVLISVIDRNDYQPAWTADKYDGSVPERDSNVTILRFGVTDQDTPHTSAWRVVYTINKGNERGNFKIETDPETNEGLLTVIKPLDFENGPLNKLSISVANEEPFFMCKVVKKSSSGLWVVDTGKTLVRMFQETQTRTTLITVLDVNDPPVLHPPRISIYMEETNRAGLRLGVLNASDPDTAFPNKIKYQVFYDPAGWILIDENTGVITSKTILDRESHYVVKDTYTAVLLAVDDGVPPMTGTATLVINLKDVNDNTPQLRMAYVIACAGEGEAVVTVPVEDKDINPYSGPFHFELLEKERLKEQLALKDISGDSLQVLQLKGARRGNHTIRLQISDKQGMTSLQNLTVHVCDCINGSTCLNMASGPPSIGGGAIALLLLALILLCVGCLLLCKISSGKVMVPFDQEPLNTMVVYNEEAGNKDCETSAMLMSGQNQAQNQAQQSSGSQVYAGKEEVDGNFHRASTRRYAEEVAVGSSNFVKVDHSYSTQSHNMSEKPSTFSQFDRASKRRHSEAVAVGSSNFAKVNHSNSTQEAVAVGSSNFVKVNHSNSTQEAVAVGSSNFVKVNHSNSTQSHNMSEQESTFSQFDRASKRRHSSYQTKEQQRASRFERALVRRHSIAAVARRTSLVRNTSVNGYQAHTLAASGGRRTSVTTESAITEYKLKNLESFLRQTLQNSSTDENIQENYKPRVFADEGEPSRASSLETISIVGSNFNLDRLHYLGSKFNILENICAKQIEIKSQSEEDEEPQSPSI